MEVNKVCIIGLGFMGGSLAMAIKKKKLANIVIGTSRRVKTVKKALARKIIDIGIIDHAKAVKDADIVFICTPINKIIPVLKEIAGALKPGAIVTDIGSTKEAIVRSAEKIMPKRAAFIGGHPMAGSEKVGIDSVIPTLYEGTTYIITPTKRTDRMALKVLTSFINRLNVKVLFFPPEKQDLLVAGISHLPLAVASSLVNAIAGMGKYRGEMMKVASSGFRDTTRVASGDPGLGIDLFTTNKKMALRMISAFKKSLGNLESAIKSGRGIEKELKKAKSFRDKIYG
ncbi:MAG: prephenate dehydrogenase/arogenate dehydrogenase family protein [Candidatus Saganbacteria bacterium]|nr:prephenate dehydrogenase/arogenate dehydrogenase family protein [Candidatus Saganbacteria bacterium]